MDAMNRSKLIAELERDEGCVLHAYKDSLGYLTIGVGRNIDKRGPGITKNEAYALLSNDILKTEQDCMTLPAWKAIKGDAVRERVLLNMCFNMGLGKLKGFRNTLKAMEEKRWADAANGMRASLWARQVGARAERLAKMMETGQD